MPDQSDQYHSGSQDRRAMNATILSLLEENREDMKHLHTCMHETNELVAGLQQYFIGVTPADHIRDHSVLRKAALDTEAQRLMYRNIKGTIIGAVLIATGTWLYTYGTEFLSKHVTVKYTAPVPYILPNEIPESMPYILPDETPQPTQQQPTQQQPTQQQPTQQQPTRPRTR